MWQDLDRHSTMELWGKVLQWKQYFLLQRCAKKRKNDKWRACRLVWKGKVKAPPSVKESAVATEGLPCDLAFSWLGRTRRPCVSAVSPCIWRGTKRKLNMPLIQYSPYLCCGLPYIGSRLILDGIYNPLSAVPCLSIPALWVGLSCTGGAKGQHHQHIAARSTCFSF